MSQSTKSVLQSLSERGDLGLLGDGFRVWLMAAQLVRQCLCVCVLIDVWLLSVAARFGLSLGVCVCVAGP